MLCQKIGPRHKILEVMLFLPFFLTSSVFAQDKNQQVASSEFPLQVNSVEEEYEYIANQRCTCGGTYEVISQWTLEKDGKHIDELKARCTKCEKERIFSFDVSSLFEQYDLMLSKEAREKTFAALSKKYPQPTAGQIPEFVKILDSADPNAKLWAIQTIAAIGTEEAINILLDRYLTADVMPMFDYRDCLANKGELILSAVDERLREQLTQEQRWRLIDLLGETGSPKARAIIEGQIRDVSPQLRRIAYISLGRLACKESENVLLECLEQEKPSPDDALIWALGRCATKTSFSALWYYAEHGEKAVRLTAIAALGVAGDETAIPFLITILKNEKSLVTQSHAIYALGQLKTKEAVPLLIECLKKGPVIMESMERVYIYDNHVVDGNDTFGFAVEALGRIGDSRALPAFREILRNEDTWLSYASDVARACAQMWAKEMVPDLIERLEKDQGQIKEFAGVADQAQSYGPHLKALTGQDFGDDAEKWRAWLETQTSK